MAAHVFYGDVVIKDKLIVDKVAGAEAVNLPDAINKVANLANTYITSSNTEFTFTPDDGNDNTGLEAHYGANYDNIWFNTGVLKTIRRPSFSIGFNIYNMWTRLQDPSTMIGTIYYNDVSCGNIVYDIEDNYNIELDKQYTSAATTGKATVKSNSSVVYNKYKNFICLASSASNAKATQKIEIDMAYDIAIYGETWAIRVPSLTIRMPNHPYIFNNDQTVLLILETPDISISSSTELMDKNVSTTLTATQNLSSIGGKYIGTNAYASNDSNLYPLITL